MQFSSAILFIVVAVGAPAISAEVPAEVPAIVLCDSEGAPIIWVFGDVDEAPSPVFEPTPLHPHEFNGIEGVALLRFRVDTSGGVQDLRIVQASERAFGVSAYQAHHKARYRPAKKNGAIVECEVERLIRFPVEVTEKKEAQPGATDNPDDAQRLREDH